MPDTDTEGARVVADRIARASCDDAGALHVGPLCCTVGFSTFTPTSEPSQLEPASLDALALRLVDNADRALYSAKEQGGGRTREGQSTVLE